MNTIEIVLKMPEIVWSWNMLFDYYTFFSGIIVAIMGLSILSFMHIRASEKPEDIPLGELFLSIPFILLFSTVFKFSDVTLVEKSSLEQYRNKAETLDQLYGDDLE